MPSCYNSQDTPELKFIDDMKTHDTIPIPSGFAERRAKNLMLATQDYSDMELLALVIKDRRVFDSTSNLGVDDFMLLIAEGLPDENLLIEVLKRKKLHTYLTLLHSIDEIIKEIEIRNLRNQLTKIDRLRIAQAAAPELAASQIHRKMDK
ncbi:hypothetical protein SEMRO_3201_G345100.1 [Seminavis robusta]|uniref:Uncharacterized protein n=1 Tax=Seminavis robusta TaxID=568900 RepID=A0A9N8F3L8_9STRA|nr:hypothetical protein SEMRO_3201_G345100.1 [Seminavis robusta]|eukprot:Sro3201_g345100.1 n/a (150) ;mRNA; f:2821-3270